jgi:hypothetical protein
MNTTIRRILSTAATVGVLSLATAWPGVAKPEWTEPAAPSDGSSAPLCSPPPACYPTGEPRTVTREVQVDDEAWEYVQIGLGALAGASVAGAAAAAGVALRRRGQHAPRPT